MDIFIYLAVIAALLSLASFFRTTTSRKRIARDYSYQKKEKVMTDAEGRFFEHLTRIAGDRFFIMPQAHLSSFLEHKVKGQSWRGAFSAINGKSIDFLLIEKNTLRPVVAIELDDWSHKREDRVLRDDKVSHILSEAGILFARFDNPDLAESEIFNTINKLAEEAKAAHRD